MFDNKLHYFALVLRKTVSIRGNDKRAAESLLDKYERKLDYMRSIYAEIDIRHTFEIVEKKNNKINLHCHAMVVANYPYELITPPREKGISTYFEECNPLAWVVYCAKEPYTREKVLEYIDLQIHGIKSITIPHLVDEASIERHKQQILYNRLKKIRLV